MTGKLGSHAERHISDKCSLRNTSPALHRYASMLLVLSPLLDIYGYSGFLSFYYVFSVVLIFFTIWKYGVLSNVPILFTVYLIYRLCITWTTKSLMSVYHTILIVVQYFIYMSLMKNVDTNLFIKYYKIVAIISIFLFFFQELTYNATGYRTSGIIPFLPFHLYEGDKDGVMNSQIYGDRSCSFFAEPAHFAQFLLPLVAIILFQNQKKGKIKWLVWLGLTFVLLRSGNGFVGLMPIFIVYLYQVLFKSSLKGKIVGCFCIVFILAGGIYFLKTESGIGIMERTEELNDSGSPSAASGFVRIYRGYYIYNEMSPIEKIFGQDNDDVLLTYVRQSVVGDI